MSAGRDLVAVLDVGTSSVRSALYGFDAEPIRGSETRVAYQPRVDPSGRAELDAVWLAGRCRSVLARTCRAVRARDRVGAVGVSCFWHSLLGLDGAGRPVTPVWLWSDQRSWRQAAELAADRRLADVHDRTGAPLHTSYWPAKLAWCRAEQPRLFERVRHWVSFTDYLYLALFGDLGTTRSMASGTGLTRLDDGGWDRALARRLGVDRATLPPPIEEYGALRPAVRRELPSLAGARWFGAAGDGATATVGSDGDRNLRRALTIGTSAAMRSATAVRPASLPRSLWCYVIEEGTFLVGGAFNNGGNLHAWLADRLHLGPERLERALRRLPPASAGLTFLPLLSGERSPGFAPRATGAISGLTEATTGIDVARAGMEAVAVLLRPVDRGLDELLSGTGRIVISGGGLVRSGAWCQVVADTLGKPVSSVLVGEASSRGAAILALRRLGAPRPRRLPLARTWRPRP
ncbi:MAG: gluconokinase, partial [Candidatus Dormibacteraceae bacterium]